MRAAGSGAQALLAYFKHDVWVAAGPALRTPCRWRRQRRRCRQHLACRPPAPACPVRYAAEVLPVKSGLSGDVTKRGGRWESDFIWNKVRGTAD